MNDIVDIEEEEKEIIFKQSGGRYSQLRKDEVLQAMDFTYPGWRDEKKTFVFPVITEPTFAGPVTDDSSEYDKGIVKGFHSEVDVLWALKKVSQVLISSTFYEQLFCTKVFCTAFLYLQFGFEIFCQKIMGAKAVGKMFMVKLTTGKCTWTKTFPRH
jgi:hypothetical protein